MAASTAPTRGQLLRSVGSLTNDIVSSNARFQVASARLTDATATKSELLRQIAAADAMLSALDAKKRHESENDGELVALQHANAAMAVKKQDLVRQTRQARAERERLKDSVHDKYYARLGAALECERSAIETAVASSEAAAAGGSGGVVALGLPASGAGWDAATAALLSDAEALWRRVSTQAASTRDILDGSLARRSLGLQPVAGAAVAGPDSFSSFLSSAGAGTADSATGFHANGREEAAAGTASGNGTTASRDDGGVADGPSQEGTQSPAPSYELSASHIFQFLALGRGRGQQPLPKHPADATESEQLTGSPSVPPDIGEISEDETDWQAAALNSDAAKALEVLSACLKDLQVLRETAAQQISSGSETDIEAPSMSAVSALLELIKQNIRLQQGLLRACSEGTEEGIPNSSD